MDIPEIIQKKSKKLALSEKEIIEFVCGSVNGLVEECQIGAMLMAMFLNGLNEDETYYLTKALAYSGEILRWDDRWSGLLVDKHCTGGVGDKVSIVLAPVLAACNLKVPMISGWGLGITGGTLDKLQSIPGFTVSCTNLHLDRCLQEVGCFIAGANNTLCPGDGVLYKIRDATATVGNHSLIQASILSKKVAEGTNFLVLDVKVGKGTFFKTIDEARHFSKQLKQLSVKMGINTRILLTRMDSPIGYMIGNALEVEEAIICLQGRGNFALNQLVITLGAHLLEMAGQVKDFAEGKSMIDGVLTSGAGLTYFSKMLCCQGVQLDVATKLCTNDVKTVLPRTKYQTYFKTNSAGWIKEIDASLLGQICVSLGAGRKRSTDTIDYSVGVCLLRIIGDKVDRLEDWLQLHHSEENISDTIRDKINNAVVISDTYVQPEDLIIERECALCELKEYATFKL